jgi:hypothetical protein
METTRRFFKVGSQSIFDRIYTVMRTYFDDLIVVTAHHMIF